MITLGGTLYESFGIVLKAMWPYLILFVVVRVVKNFIKKRNEL